MSVSYTHLTYSPGARYSALMMPMALNRTHTMIIITVSSFVILFRVVLIIDGSPHALFHHSCICIIT